MTALAPTRVERLRLKQLDALDGAMELIYFGLRGATREADELLALYGLSRAHHRILFVIARRDGITVGELRASLGISAQAMHRPLKALQDAGFVATSRDPARHRYKALHLSARGRDLEHEASERERATWRAAFAAAKPGAAEAWAEIMTAVAANV